MVSSQGEICSALAPRHYQSATKLACKLETNVLNNEVPIFPPFLELCVIHFP